MWLSFNTYNMFTKASTRSFAVTLLFASISASRLTPITFKDGFSLRFFLVLETDRVWRPGNHSRSWHSLLVLGYPKTFFVKKKPAPLPAAALTELPIFIVVLNCFQFSWRMEEVRLKWRPGCEFWKFYACFFTYLLGLVWARHTIQFI